MYPRQRNPTPMAAIGFAAITLGVAFWLLILVILLLVAVAHAAPPPGASGRYHEWFASQKIPAGDPQAGLSCCAESDGHIIEEDDWRVAAGHYQIRVGEGWFMVPDTRVLPFNDNPTGKPVAWYNKYPSGPLIYCFTPGTVS